MAAWAWVDFLVMHRAGGGGWEGALHVNPSSKYAPEIHAVCI